MEPSTGRNKERYTNASSLSQNEKTTKRGKKREKSFVKSGAVHVMMCGKVTKRGQMGVIDLREHSLWMGMRGLLLIRFFPICPSA